MKIRYALTNFAQYMNLIKKQKQFACILQRFEKKTFIRKLISKHKLFEIRWTQKKNS